MASSRPDPTHPTGVASAAFTTVRKGYDPDAVRTFLRQVADQMVRLENEIHDLRNQLDSRPGTPTLDEAQVAGLIGEETARIVQAAREAGAEIRRKAEDAAAQMVREADEEARRQRAAGEHELAKLRDSATAEANAELEAARQQGRQMVGEAREYREKVLSDVNRRRELARQQLAQVLQGRDQLVQAFEQARAAAAQVLDELGAFHDEEPDEVNLSPITGPVPVTVPGGRRQRAAVAESAEPAEATEATEVPEVPEAELTDVEVGIEADLVVVEVEIAEEGEGAGLRDEEAPARANLRIVGPFDYSAPVDEGAHTPEAGDSTADAAAAPPVADESEAADDSGAVPGQTAAVDEEPDRGPASGATAVTDPSGLYAGELDVPSGKEHGEKASVDDLFAKLRRASAEMVAREAAAAPAATTDEPSADAGQPEETAAAADPFAARDEALVPLIIASARKLKRVLADEQNEVLDHLRRNQIGDMLPTEAEHATRYASAIQAELHAAATAGAAAVGGSRPRRDSSVMEPPRAALKAGIVVPLRERVERCVDEAGDDTAAVANLVRAVYREWKSSRIDDGIDDVLRLAYDEGMYAAIPAGTPLLWVRDPGSNACGPDCEDNSLSGEIAAGAPFPTGHLHPPLHDGCRCLVQISHR